MSVDMKDYLAYQQGYEAGKRDADSPWHRVEEELPDPGQDVLVYTYFYGRSIYAVAWLDNEGKWSFGTVTNWMPIEPPMETERSKT